MQIHLIMPFSRPENKQRLIDGYRSMNIDLHPIMFQDEETEWNEPWIFPTVLPITHAECKAFMPGCFKRNWFIQNADIIDEDYYLNVDDDDFYEDGVFQKIKQMDDEVIIISMKRGQHTPEGLPKKRQYPTYSLYASPYNVKVGEISTQQPFVKGRLYKEKLHNEGVHHFDGLLAIYWKNTAQVRYEPDLFALFNYFEKGRWE